MTDPQKVDAAPPIRMRVHECLEFRPLRTVADQEQTPVFAMRGKTLDCPERRHLVFDRKEIAYAADAEFALANAELFTGGCAHAGVMMKSAAIHTVVKDHHTVGVKTSPPRMMIA